VRERDLLGADVIALMPVRITRAKKELIVTWNVGGFENAPKQPAALFLALYTYLAEKASC